MTIRICVLNRVTRRDPNLGADGELQEIVLWWRLPAGGIGIETPQRGIAVILEVQIECARCADIAIERALDTVALSVQEVTIVQARLGSRDLNQGDAARHRAQSGLRREGMGREVRQIHLDPLAGIGIVLRRQADQSGAADIAVDRAGLTVGAAAVVDQHPQPGHDAAQAARAGERITGRGAPAAGVEKVLRGNIEALAGAYVLVDHAGDTAAAVAAGHQHPLAGRMCRAVLHLRDSRRSHRLPVRGICIVFGRQIQVHTRKPIDAANESVDSAGRAAIRIGRTNPHLDITEQALIALLAGLVHHQPVCSVRENLHTQVHRPGPANVAIKAIAHTTGFIVGRELNQRGVFGQRCQADARRGVVGSTRGGVIRCRGCDIDPVPPGPVVVVHQRQVELRCRPQILVNVAGPAACRVAGHHQHTGTRAQGTQAGALGDSEIVAGHIGQIGVQAIHT